MAQRPDSGMEDTISADELAEEGLPAHVLEPGSLFAGRYLVEARVGAGGMGTVFRVRDEKLGETVALKLLTLQSERAIERFLREVRLARRVTHPNVARTHDLGEEGGVHFLTMEYVPGTSLDRVIAEEGALAPVRAARIAEQICAGLEAAHGAGVIHRDLKPANVLLSGDGRVVLTDFGIARGVQPDATGQKTVDLVGTPQYMSPEQVAGKPVGPPSDLYALGLILYELLTATLPFAGDTPFLMALARLREAPADPRSRVPDIPGGLADLTLRCLALEPADRPPSAAAVCAALAPFVAGASATGSTTSTPGTSIPPFAPISPGERALAVLPFRYRGPADSDYLGESLAEELIDVLARTRGLKVLSLGATSRFSDERDPGRIGTALGAEAVVDGTVQLAGARVRVAARLVTAGTGVQSWSGTFEGLFEDVLTLQESMGRRIAEELRLEVEARTHGSQAPPEAIELYMRARRILRATLVLHGDEVMDMLDRCIELAPDFAPGLAAHAMASVRAWWSPNRGPRAGELAQESVERACARAPEFAETHLSRAMLATQHGRYAEATSALSRALEITPTLAEAHQYLGDLQVEAGRPKEGRTRLLLALELDPRLHVCRLPLARMAALRGDRDEAARWMAELREAIGAAFPLLVAELRHSLYLGDLDTARARQEELETHELPGRAIARFASFAFGGIDEQEAEGIRRLVPETMGNPRFASLISQLAVELYSTAGRYDLAQRALDDLADGVLIDIEWLDRCKLFEPMRGTPAFDVAVDRVRARARTLWSR